MSDRPSGSREGPADDCRPSNGIQVPMRRREMVALSAGALTSVVLYACGAEEDEAARSAAEGAADLWMEHRNIVRWMFAFRQRLLGWLVVGPHSYSFQNSKAFAPLPSGYTIGNRQREKAQSQHQRDAIGDGHGEKVARGSERHQGRKQQQANDIENHGLIGHVRVGVWPRA